MQAIQLGQIPNLGIPPFLIQNFPNPMTHSTKISFSNAQPVFNASVEIYNTKGQLINTIPIIGGQSYVVWNGTDFNDQQVSNGIYLYKLETEDRIITKRLLLLR